MEHSQDVTKIPLSLLNLSENCVSVLNYIVSYRIVSLAVYRVSYHELNNVYHIVSWDKCIATALNQRYSMARPILNVRWVSAGITYRSRVAFLRLNR